MKPNLITDEDLMSCADGQADVGTEQRIDAAMEEDETIASRLAVFAETRETVYEAYAEKLKEEPVPDALLAAVRDMAARSERERQTPSNVISLAERRQARQALLLPGAISAMVLLGLGFGAAQFTRSPTTEGGTQIAALADPAILDSLESIPSGSNQSLEGGDTFRAIASFRDVDGKFCREFEHIRPAGHTYVGVACDAGDAWDIKLVIATGAETGYAPASALETLDAWLVSTEAGAPLSASEEMQALEAVRTGGPTPD
jgi:hypothetical protein